MSKILLEIYIPASDKSFEMRIPSNIKVKKLEIMISNYLSTHNELEIEPKQNCILCYENSGEPIELNSFVGELGLKDGKRILFV